MFPSDVTKTPGWFGSGGDYAGVGDLVKKGTEAVLFKGKGPNRELDKMALAALALGGMSYIEAKKQFALAGEDLEDYGIFSAEDYEATDWEGWAEGTHLEGAAKMAQGGRVNYGIGGWLKKKLGIGQAEGHAEASGERVAQDPEIMRQKLLSYFRNKYSGDDWKQDFRDEWSSPFVQAAHGGRIGHANGGIHNARPGYLWGSDKGEGLGGEEVEADMRFTGGFMPYGEEPKADDVPARLSKDEFVFTDQAVAGAGQGDVNVGAERLYNIMKQLEQQGSPGGTGIGTIVKWQYNNHKIYQHLILKVQSKVF